MATRPHPNVRDAASLLSRRELLNLAAYAVALPGAAHFFSTWLTAAQHQQHSIGANAPEAPPLLRDYAPRFFDRDDFAALRAFTEILIPTDDTPGAREAHCAHFIDFVLQASTEYAPDAQKQWVAAMQALRDAGFHAADSSGRAALVEAMSRPERERGATHPAYFAYRLIKQQNSFAFYTSRAGMIEALDYRGNSYNAHFPACEHPEHRVVSH
jgi:gluconate 2-dehydrogenase subunit 3-like protein